MKLSLKPGQFLANLFRRFTLPTFLCIYIAVIYVIQSNQFYTAAESYSSINDHLNRLLFIGWSGLCWSVAGCCLQERYGWRKLMSYIVGVTGLLIAAVLPTEEVLCGSLMLFMVCLCFHAVSAGDSQHERLSLVCGSFFVSLGLSVVIWIALSIIFGTIPELFLPDVSWRVSSCINNVVTALSFFVVAPWLFLGGLPRMDEPVARSSSFRRFSARLLLPLYLLLLGDLLLYVLKILVTWTMPVGVMNGYALAALTLFTFFHLILNGEENQVSRVFTRFGGFALIPILVAQQVGVWIRIDAYGFTPSRIFGLALTLLCAAAVVFSLLRKRANWFFLAACVMAVVVIGSPFNADYLSRVDQENRLRVALERNAMLSETGEIVANPAADADDQAIIYSAVLYLDDVEAPAGSLTAQLQSQLDSIAKERGDSYVTTACHTKLLGFANSDAWYSRTVNFTGSADHDKLDARGFDQAEWIELSIIEPQEEDEDVYTQTHIPADFDIDAIFTSLAPIWDSSSDGSLPVLPITFPLGEDEVSLETILATAVDSESNLLRSITYTLTEDEVALASGRVLRISAVSLTDYNDDSYWNSVIKVTGWLLTPANE